MSWEMVSCRATNGRFSRTCSWKTYALLRAIDQLIKVLIQTWLMFFFFSFDKWPFFFFFFLRKAKTTAVTIQSGRIRSCNFFSLCVQDARIQRKGRYRWIIHLENYIFVVPLLGRDARRNTDEKFLQISRPFARGLSVATSLEKLIFGLHLSRNGPKLLYRSILSSLRTWERVFQNRETFAKVLR